MSRMFLCVIAAAVTILLIGCASSNPVHSEQGLAKCIGETGLIEGTYESDAKGEWIRTAWGRVPVQRNDHAPAHLEQGVYVWASGHVARGQLVNGAFVPTPADSRGLRMAHDLILLKAKLQRHAPSATQPTTMPWMMESK